MAYNALIPNATDKISNSQADIKENFTQIKTLIDINHVTFGAADQGKHKFVTFPDQTASGAPATAGLDINMYNLPVGGVQQLYIKRASGTAIPFTQYYTNGSSRGWTYLPSGIIMVWGRETGSALNPATYNFADGLIGLPTFTNASPMVQVVRVRNSPSGDNTQVWLSSTTTTTFTVTRSTSGSSTIDFAWLAVGI